MGKRNKEIKSNNHMLGISRTLTSKQ